VLLNSYQLSIFSNIILVPPLTTNSCAYAKNEA
jgi:hypothetical protein